MPAAASDRRRSGAWTDGDVIATPVVANGVVYVSSGGGVIRADERSGDARWTVNLGSPFRRPPPWRTRSSTSARAMDDSTP
jgi:outer membrane protein assembly factor BamB